MFLVPAHVEMMGLIGMGNNPMVGATLIKMCRDPRHTKIIHYSLFIRLAQTLCLVADTTPQSASPTAPLTQLAFERRQWRIQRERQAAAVRKCESE